MLVEDVPQCFSTMEKCIYLTSGYRVKKQEDKEISFLEEALKKLVTEVR